MYHIRRADTHEERSLHMENEIGLQRAMQEAALRTVYTGVEHEVVDSNGGIHAVMSEVHHEQIDGMAKVAIKPWKITQRLFWISAVFVALLLSGAFH
jgi:hypothetical protein